MKNFRSIEVIGLSDGKDVEKLEVVLHLNVCVHDSDTGVVEKGILHGILLQIS